ncbi:MAG TPA: glycoside hydrolase family 25 protein [Candidatus Deferrimicrobiaceae bacterium]|nr:glycoside hydrolase family 25 protein [Candidatus Deferrimicrobiaceae bacterium]
MSQRHRSGLPFAMAVVLALAALPFLASRPAAAAGTDHVTNCRINLRGGPSTSTALVATLPKDSVVSVSATVSGGAWTTHCGTSVAGATWFKVVAIDGRSVASRYGTSILYAATGLFHPAPAPTPDYRSNCGVNLRATASTGAWIRGVVARNAVVTAAATVSGGRWRADCGRSVSGSRWLKIVAINGRSVHSLYGVSAVYAARGLFTSIPLTGYLEGIDVSNWQGRIDWARVRAAGVRFAIAKASEGVGYEDRSYDRNRAGALAQGIAFGAYHFARPENNPIKEADWFIEVASYRRGMIIPTLDLERTGGRNPTGLANWTKAWLTRVHERLGVRAMIYVSPSFWRQNLVNTEWFARHGYHVVWIAHWRATNPKVPASSWNGRSWTFWQYSTTGSVPGISGPVDLNRYRYAGLAAVLY